MAKLADQVDFVGDGDELIRYLDQAEKPDMIILDLAMPKKDGIQALREINCDERLRCIPVVVLTGSERDEDHRLAEAEGVHSYIVKGDMLLPLFKAVQELRNQIASRTARMNG